MSCLLPLAYIRRPIFSLIQRHLKALLPVALILSTAAGLLQSPTVSAERPERGYIATRCGFDLDDDGIRGEPLDDCRICDGVTLDPDGDGINEDLIYIDASAGNDLTGTGNPGTPFQTLAKAFQEADGPADGAEDIFCLQGEAAEQHLTPSHGGVPGIKVLPQAGSQGRSFELPTEPSMLVGWDVDQDGCYPPYDDGVTDVANCGTNGDVAVLNGNGLDQAMVLAVQGDPDNPGINNGLRYFEMAHLQVNDYGYQTAAGEDIGFVRFGRGAESSHLYLHDLELNNINRGKPNAGNAITFNFFVGEMKTSFILIDNIEVLNAGSYFARGTFGAVNIDGPFRFSNISFTAFGCSEIECGTGGSLATVTGFKIWGVADGFEVLDSIFDAQTAAWDPRPNGPVNAIIPNACSRDWLIRNNEFYDWGTTLLVKGSEGACGVRPTDDVVFDANLVVASDLTNWPTGVSGVSLGDDGTSTVENSIADVTVINNFFDAAPGVGWRRMFVSEAGNDVAPGPGTVVFSANTVRGAPAFGGWALVQLLVGDSENGGLLQFPLPRFRIENNIFTGLDGGNEDDRLIFRADYVPAELIVNRNTLHPTGTYVWVDGLITDLAGWRAGTGLDTASRSCVPTFESDILGDLHLAPGDNCAQNIGGNLSNWTDVDFDRNFRDHGPGLEAGADELSDHIIFIGGFD